eukprot:TRINITY_DN14490_c0_g1_i1.p1 TRINITY_DN14490_c0_g1~~TRINITY_DN14490_c0_g1_i1.p1  ORF type:complete len:569 (+),score=127.53 TRINITY_DN14490_c0_g1_i1:71-1708(+)
MEAWHPAEGPYGRHHAPRDPRAAGGRPLWTWIGWRWHHLTRWSDPTASAGVCALGVLVCLAPSWLNRSVLSLLSWVLLAALLLCLAAHTLSVAGRPASARHNAFAPFDWDAALSRAAQAVLLPAASLADAASAVVTWRDWVWSVTVLAFSTLLAGIGQWLDSTSVCLLLWLCAFAVHPILSRCPRSGVHLLQSGSLSPRRSTAVPQRHLSPSPPEQHPGGALCSPPPQLHRSAHSAAAAEYREPSPPSPPRHAQPAVLRGYSPGLLSGMQPPSPAPACPSPGGPTPRTLLASPLPLPLPVSAPRTASPTPQLHPHDLLPVGPSVERPESPAEGAPLCPAGVGSPRAPRPLQKQPVPVSAGVCPLTGLPYCVPAVRGVDVALCDPHALFTDAVRVLAPAHLQQPGQPRWLEQVLVLTAEGLRLYDPPALLRRTLRTESIADVQAQQAHGRLRELRIATRLPQDELVLNMPRRPQPHRLRPPPQPAQAEARGPARRRPAGPGAAGGGVGQAAPDHRRDISPAGSRDAAPRRAQEIGARRAVGVHMMP